MMLLFYTVLSFWSGYNPIQIAKQCLSSNHGDVANSSSRINGDSALKIWNNPCLQMFTVTPVVAFFG